MICENNIRNGKKMLTHNVEIAGEAYSYGRGVTDVQWDWLSI